VRAGHPRAITGEHGIIWDVPLFYDRRIHRNGVCVGHFPRNASACRDEGDGIRLARNSRERVAGVLGSDVVVSGETAKKITGSEKEEMVAIYTVTEVGTCLA